MCPKELFLLGDGMVSIGKVDDSKLEVTGEPDGELSNELELGSGFGGFSGCKAESGDTST